MDKGKGKSDYPSSSSSNAAAEGRGIVVREINSAFEAHMAMQYMPILCLLCDDHFTNVDKLSLHLHVVHLNGGRGGGVVRDPLALTLAPSELEPVLPAPEEVDTELTLATGPAAVAAAAAARNRNRSNGEIEDPRLDLNMDLELGL